MRENINDLVESASHISSSLAIFNQINEAVNNPEISFSNIADIINKDSALSVRLLKIANSSFYSFPSSIDTIKQAVTVIGTSQLRDLVLATTVVNSFKGINENLINMDLFWQHSIACGLASRIIAIYRRELNADRFYVAGMLHDIGRLILYTQIPDQANEAIRLAQTKGILLRDAENEVMEFDHAAVGGVLLQAWKLPLILIETVTFHHDPGKALQYPSESAIVHFADIITLAMRIGSSGESFVPPLDTGAWEKIGLPVSIISSVLKQLEKQLDDAMQMFTC